MINPQLRLLGSALIIAGVNIGVGMLALPVITAKGGFFPATILYTLCCFFMVILSRLILEACTWLPLGSNLITIAKTFLGFPGEIACWIVYLFLFYCLLVAHIAAGGNTIVDISHHFFSPRISTVIYFLIFTPVVYLGTKSVERLNFYLMIGVVCTFALFAITALPHVEKTLIFERSWLSVSPAIFASLAAFGFQNLVPTLYTYLKGDHQTVRKAIWLGTLIPLIFYIIWEMLTVGVIPKHNLLEAKVLEESAVEPLQQALSSSLIPTFALWFASLAMSTSFMGMSIAFMDFWADGLGLKKKGWEHALLMVLVFALPLAAVLTDPYIFLVSLNLAGGVGEILLYGILPALYVWSGRYIHRKSLSHQFVPGGKVSLILIFSISLAILLSIIL